MGLSCSQCDRDLAPSAPAALHPGGKELKAQGRLIPTPPGGSLALGRAASPSPFYCHIQWPGSPPKIPGFESKTTEWLSNQDELSLKQVHQVTTEKLLFQQK